MNRIGGKSNTGEGGEDRRRYAPVKAGETLQSRLGKSRIEIDIALKEGDSLKSKIKQVASGRFGVTAEYLASAEQIQIKIAQGAKPGEGGQLPGRKVSEYIAELRYSTPGVELISPPPHHDIYSIEDLAQLIHDLKNANPHASISVKLVSEVGVGTVAAGVAKAQVRPRHDRRPRRRHRRSPWSSIKHAGTPWELGLAETQQTLVLNRLRGRIAVQVDGQMKTGRDVVIGALLGADEFGFATAPLVVEGCIMMRKCHLNTCPVGVATQDPVLRRKFAGKPEHVINYFFFVAEEVRELMAQLGVRRLNDLIGRTELLDMRKGIEHWKAKGLDFSQDLPHAADAARGRALQLREAGPRAGQGARPPPDRARAAGARARREGDRSKCRSATSTARSARCCRTRSRSATATRDCPMTPSTSASRARPDRASARSSRKGVTLDLIGDTNDYCGKGLSGGRISVQPSPKFRGEPTENIITGNVVLYGAIAGEAYFRGVAGERFAVRNSGAQAVVEGVGDHGCEYMTGGTVVVLGVTGRNFAAGMSGGIAYVLDEDGTFASRCNPAMVTLEPVLAEAEQEAKLARELWHIGAADEAMLKRLIEKHARHTGSARAQAILENWASFRARFVKVFPKEYRRALGELAAKGTKIAATRDGLAADGQDHRISGVRARSRRRYERARRRASSTGASSFRA